MRKLALATLVVGVVVCLVVLVAASTLCVWSVQWLAGIRSVYGNVWCQVWLIPLN